MNFFATGHNGLVSVSIFACSNNFWVFGSKQLDTNLHALCRLHIFRELVSMCWYSKEGMSLVGLQLQKRLFQVILVTSPVKSGRDIFIYSCSAQLISFKIHSDSVSEKYLNFLIFLFKGFKFSRCSYVLSLLRPQIMKDLKLKVLINCFLLTGSSTLQ